MAIKFFILVSLFLCATSVMAQSVQEREPESESSSRGFAYINNGAVISVIDLTNYSVTHTIDLKDIALGIAVNAAGTRIYVTQFHSPELMVIDTASKTVIAKVKFEDRIGFRAVAVNKEGTRVYVTAETSILIIDTEKNSVVGKIDKLDNPVSIAIDPVGTRAYVLCRGNISVIDLESNLTILSVPIIDHENFYSRIVISPDGKRVYAANKDQIFILEIDKDKVSTRVLKSKEKNHSYNDLALNPEGTLLYAACNTPYLSVIDTKTITEVARVQVEDEPLATIFALSINPDGTRLCVTDSDRRTFLIIDTSNNSVIKTIKLMFIPLNFGQFISPR